MFRWGKYLKCQNAVSHGAKACWNHVQVPIDIVQTKVVAWMLSVLESYPEFRKTLVQAAWREILRVGERDAGRNSVRTGGTPRKLMDHSSNQLQDRDLRQREIVPPERLAACHGIVIGVGAIGRQITLQLAAVGIPRMTLILDAIAVRLDYRIALEKEDFPADGEIVFDTGGGFRVVRPRSTTSTPAPSAGVRQDGSNPIPRRCLGGEGMHHRTLRSRPPEAWAHGDFEHSKFRPGS